MAGVQPTKFINYISQFKKLLVTRNNGIISQKFKIDSATDDNYYFSIVNSNNRLIDLTGRTFKIYGSIFDSKDQMHILFYSDKCTIEQNGQQMHFKIDTYTSQYMNIVKTNKIIDLTIVEVVNPDDEIPDEEQITQVILRDTAIAYKRPYIENQTPAEILQKVILTTNVPLTGVFGSGQDINLTIGSNGAAFGTGLTQTGDNQLVIGKYNEVDNTKAFVIGNGDNETARSNIFAIDYNGNIATPGTLSATGVYVNGKEVGTDTDEKLSATSAWVNDTFETKNAAIAVQQQLTQEIEGVDSKVDALSTSSNNKFELKTDATGKFNTLSAAIPTNNNQLTNGANYITLAQVPVYTGSGAVVVNQNHVISLTGQLGKTYFADDETLKLNTTTNTFSIKNLSSIVHAGDDGIELVFDAAGNMTIYNTGGGGGGTGAIYRPGEGLSLGENNTFSVDTEWLSGKIDSAISGLENYTAGYGIAIVGDEKAITLTADIPEYVSSLLDASLYAKSADVNNLVVATSAQIIGYVDNKFETQLDSALKYNTLTGQTDYLSGQIDNALSSIDDIGSETTEKIDYVSGFVSGLPSAIDLKAAQTDLEALSTTVEGLAETKADISSVYTKEEVYTYLETDAKIEQATSGKADQSTVESLSTNLSTAIDTKANSADVYTKSQVYTKDETDTAINTATSGKVNKSDFDTVTGALSTAIDTKTTSSEVKTQIEAYGYQNATDVANAISGKADKSELQSVSGTLNTAIGGVADRVTAIETSGLITSDEVDTKIATATTDMATKTWVNGQVSGKLDTSTFETVSGELNNAIAARALQTDLQYVSGVVDNKANASALNDYVLTSAMSAYATSAWVDTNYMKKGDVPTDVYNKDETDEAIATASGNIVNWAEETFLSASQIDGYYTKDEVNTITGTLNEAITGKVEQTDFDSLCTVFSGAIDTKQTEEQVSAIVSDIIDVSGLVNSDYIDTVSANIINEIPLSTSQLTNDQFYTSGQVDQALETLSGDLTGWVGENTLTGYTAGNGIEITEDNVINLTVNTVPSAVSQLVNDTGFITEADIPLSTSDLVNDQFYTSGQVDEMFTATSAWANETFLTEHQSLDNYYNKTEVDNKDMAASANAVDVATGWVDDQNYLTAHQSLDDYYNKTQVDTALALKANAADVYTKDQVDTISGKLHNEITGAVSGMATEEWVEGHFLSSLTSADIPEEFVTETELATELEPYALSADVDTAIETASGNIETWANGKFLSAVPNTYATKEYVDGVSSSISTAIDNAGYLTAHQSLDNYYNKTQVDEISSALSTTVSEAGYLTEHQSLEGYALSADVDTSIAAATGVVTGWVDEQGYLTEHQSLDNYYNKTEIDTISSALSTGIVAQIPSLNGYATEQWVDEQGYLTAHQSLSAYATSAQIEAEYAKKTDIPSIEGLATESYVDTVSTALSTGIVAQIPSLNGYATEQWVEDKHYLTGVDLTSYATKEYVDTASAGAVDVATGWADNQGYLTAHQDLTNYALSADVTSEIATATGVVTSWVDDQNYLTAHQSLDDYATKSYVQTASGQITGWVDSQGYLTAHQDITAYALSADVTADIATATGVVTAWVDEQNYLTAHQSLDNYATNDTVQAASANAVDVATGWVDNKNYLTEVPNTYALKTDIPTDAEITGLAKDYVDTLNIATTYATKDELSSKANSADVYSKTVADQTFATKTDISDMATQTWVGQQGYLTEVPNTVSAAAVDAATGWVDEQNYLTEVPNTYALKSELPTVATLSAGMYSAISSGVEDQITGKGYQTASDVNTAINTVTGTLSTELTGWVDNQGYVTTDTTYTAGTGLKLTGTEFSLSAAGAGENKVLSSHDGVISWETNVAGGGGGTTYTAGTGIDITNDEISVKLSAATNGNIQVTENNGVIYLSAANSGGGGGSGSNNLSDYNNDVPFLEAGDLTNKQRVLPIDGATITYDPNIEIFKTIYYTGGDVTLNAVTVTTSQVANGEVATFEEWITFNSAVTSISEGTNTLIGEWPSTIDYSKTHVLVRRLYNNNGTIVQYVSYAYNF